MDMTKLDFNWGGAGYAAYDGRLEDEGEGTMDSQTRAETALAQFTNDDEEADDAAASEGAEHAEGTHEEAAEGEQEQTEGQLTEEQRAADPVFRELNEFKTTVDEVFEKHGLAAAAEANGRTPQAEADLQLSDANILYSIMRGESTPSKLLDTMEQVGNWQKPQKDAVAGDLISWLTKAGYIKDGAAAAAGDKGAGKDGKLADPLEERLSKMESAQEQRQRQEQERVVQVERDRVGKVFVDHVTKLATDAGIPKDDIPFYASQVAALVNGQKVITDRVAKGNFVDIKKFFDTVHGRELDRLKRFNDAELKKQQAKARNPKTPSGGGPAAPAGPAKRNVANRDDRIAAGVEALKGN